MASLIPRRLGSSAEAIALHSRLLPLPFLSPWLPLETPATPVGSAQPPPYRARARSFPRSLLGALAFFVSIGPTRSVTRSLLSGLHDYIPLVSPLFPQPIRPIATTNDGFLLRANLSIRHKYSSLDGYCSVRPEERGKTNERHGGYRITHSPTFSNGSRSTVRVYVRTSQSRNRFWQR